MKDILSQIVEDKRLEVAAAMQELPEDVLRPQALAVPASPRSFRDALASSPTGIISEFKRKSPSKGWIHQDAEPLQVIPEYVASGASALSILTDEKYFGGRLEFIQKVRPLVDIPILRKDFIISDYQLLQARLVGADAVLLIAACLTLEECDHLVKSAHDLGLQVLLEIHSESELVYASCGADAVGINNRNLGTFVTDVQNSFRLAEALKTYVEEHCEGKMPVLVSESGISKPETVISLREKGFRGFLMGENFMKEDDPGKALSDFCAKLLA